MNKEIALIPTQEEMKVYESISKYALDSKHFQNLGGLPGIMCIALYAREIGVSPMTAIMGGFSNVMGKITMSSELMGNLIRRNGHKLEIIESTNTICRIKGTRADTGESYVTSFSLDDARSANLVKPGSGWEKYPSDMLFARCISRLRRRLFSDIATKSYVEGELDTEVKKSEELTQPIQVEVIQQNVIVDTFGIREILEIEALIGDDTELLNRILKTYGKNKLMEMEMIHYQTIRNGLEKKYGRQSENP